MSMPPMDPSGGEQGPPGGAPMGGAPMQAPPAPNPMAMLGLANALKKKGRGKTSKKHGRKGKKK